MSLYDKSSLIQVPSLYKDGTLVSTIPEDRSGDFTVARGSNLAATRIGEDGYIKKGYENLLLQSNSFDTSPWALGNTTITSGQTGYDGSSDAWLLEVATTGNARRVQQTYSSSGLQIFSVYVKAGTTDWIILYAGGLAGRYFNVSTGAQGTTFGGTPLISNIEAIGATGYYRCSIVVNGTNTGSYIYPVDNDGSPNGTAGANIYIQDAQLNQGLVAYPYLETTTATVYSGLLENSPRLDWSNGVPAVLVEEQRTNLMYQSESSSILNSFPNLTKEDTAALSPEGVQNAMEFIPTTALTNAHYCVASNVGSLIAGTKYTFSAYVKPNGFNYVQVGGFYGNEWAFFNLSTGTLISLGANASSGNISSVGNGWYRCDVTYTYQNAIGNFVSYVGFRIYEDEAKSYYSGDGIKSVYAYGLQLEQGSYPTSYIPTYGTSQTRSNEVISDNFDIPTTATIYNSFYSDTAETVFVLDQVFNVAEGLNKVAIAFSPTAVKISVGGSIVANATGTYDTTALSNIQLGSNNGTDYSNAPISGFYVFPEFLTDEELNSLTD